MRDLDGKPKFTPGPWAVFTGPQPEDNPYWIPLHTVMRESHHTNIATVAWSESAAEENARLIASAPDLYEALRAFVDCDAFIPSLTRQSQDDLDVDTERREYVYRIALSALSKATGDPS